MKSMLSKPYDLLEQKTFKIIYVFGAAIFAFIFLWIFEPFGIYKIKTVILKFKAIGFFIATGLFLLIIQFFILQPLVLKKYNIINTIVWILLSFFIIGISSSIVNAYLFDFAEIDLVNLFIFLGRIVAVNTFFLVLFILFHYNYSLRLRLRNANNLNTQIQSNQDEVVTDKNVIINSDNKKEGFSLSVNSLLFITSVDNYVKVYLCENNNIEHKLVRYSLSKIEVDNQKISELFRCHKSYIINKNKVESISGNAGGYKIKLKNYDLLIPLSRKYNNKLSVLTSVA